MPVRPMLLHRMALVCFRLFCKHLGKWFTAPLAKNCPYAYGVKYCFCHKKITFISSSSHVMFFLLHRQKDIDKIIDFYSPMQKVIVTAQIYSIAI